jgi:tetratricopeptide (TPR) repeat protein
MVYYWLGMLSQKKSDPNNASKYFGLAAKAPLDLCFPFRNEDIEVLKAACAQNPRDSHACYLLGDCLYDKQPENAIIAWEKARELDPKLATTHRNLGWAYYRAQNNIPRAIAAYEKSIECAKDARVITELDQLYEMGGIAPEKRLAMLEGNLDVAKQRDSSYARYLMVLVQVGRYDDAIKVLAEHHFHAREGSTDIREVYVDAYLLRCKQMMDAGKYAEALADALATTEYPLNLEVGRPKNERRAAQINYCIAAAYEALGDSAKAAEYYTKAAGEERAEGRRRGRAEAASRNVWWRALALVKTGRPDEAKEIFDNLIETGKRRLAEDETIDFFAKFGERETDEERQAEAHYTIALGLVGNKQYDEARAELQKAIELNPNHLWARAQLAAIK